MNVPCSWKQWRYFLVAMPWLAAAQQEPAIIIAVRQGDMAALRQMIGRNDGLHALGAQKQTALHEAAIACNPEAAQLLVQAGVDRQARNAEGRTAEMLAMRCPASEATTRLVRTLRMPAAPKQTDEKFPWSLQDAAARGNTAVLNMLVGLKADVNVVGTKGNRALELACRNNHVEAVKVLLQAGADVRLPTAAGTSILHEAALGGNAEIIDLLVARGADVHAADGESGALPLHYAASFGRADAVKALVRHGADVGRRNRKGQTAVDVAALNGQQEMVPLLQSPPARP